MLSCNSAEPLDSKQVVAFVLAWASRSPELLACLPVQVSFPGTLYITDAHTCFSSCTRDGQEVIVIVNHKETARAAKAKPIRKGKAQKPHKGSLHSVQCMPCTVSPCCVYLLPHQSPR